MTQVLKLLAVQFEGNSNIQINNFHSKKQSLYQLTRLESALLLSVFVQQYIMLIMINKEFLERSYNLLQNQGKDDNLQEKL